MRTAALITGARTASVPVFLMLVLSTAAAEPPVALVEDVRDAVSRQVQPFDYLYSGQQIVLGENGSMVLAYFKNCRVETVSGGTVTVGVEHSDVGEGSLNVMTRECQGANPVEIAAASEAGAGVIRVTPFSAQDWDEWNVKFDRPVFTWGRGYGAVVVTVRSLQSADDATIWSVPTDQRHAVYPGDAPTLIPGEPYVVAVTGADARKLQTVFSIDPWLDVADSPLNRMVPVRPLKPAEPKEPNQ